MLLKSRILAKTVSYRRKLHWLVIVQNVGSTVDLCAKTTSNKLTSKNRTTEKLWKKSQADRVYQETVHKIKWMRESLHLDESLQLMLLLHMSRFMDVFKSPNNIHYNYRSIRFIRCSADSSLFFTHTHIDAHGHSHIQGITFIRMIITYYISFSRQNL